jgi:hypothetical protein
LSSAQGARAPSPHKNEVFAGFERSENNFFFPKENLASKKIQELNSTNKRHILILNPSSFIIKKFFSQA